MREYDVVHRGNQTHLVLHVVLRVIVKGLNVELCGAPHVTRFRGPATEIDSLHFNEI